MFSDENKRKLTIKEEYAISYTSLILINKDPYIKTVGVAGGNDELFPLALKMYEKLNKDNKLNEATILRRKKFKGKKEIEENNIIEVSDRKYIIKGRDYDIEIKIPEIKYSIKKDTEIFSEYIEIQEVIV